MAMAIVVIMTIVIIVPLHHERVASDRAEAKKQLISINSVFARVICVAQNGEGSKFFQNWQISPYWKFSDRLRANGYRRRSAAMMRSSFLP